MKCAKCSHESPADARYCEQCGDSLSALVGIGFWPRFLARVIDIILINSAGFMLIFLFAFFLGLIAGGKEPPEPTFFEATLFIIPFVVISWLYDALLESSEKQATVGKMALSLVVVDIEGRRLSFGRATGRHFAKTFLGSLLGITYLVIPFTKNHQGLHDMLADTLVVKKLDAGNTISTAPQSPGV